MLTNEYLKRVYEGLEKRNANEPEFLQAVREVLESIQPVVEKHPEYEKAGLIERLVEIQYTRNDYDFTRGSFRVHGDVLEIIPADEREHALRIEFFGDEIDRIREIEVVSGNVLSTLEHAVVFPATHYAMDR